MARLSYAMILAAGRGERMRPLTDSTPKPLIQVQGKALIDYHLENLANAGINHVAINNAHLGEQVVQHVNANQPAELQVTHFSEQIALETAGGITNALSALGDEQFLLVNGDVLCGLNFAELIPFARRVTAENPALIIGVSNPEHNPSGDFTMLELPLDGKALPENESGATLLPVQLDVSGPCSFTFSGISILHCSLFTDLKTEKAALGPMLKQLAAKDKLQALFYTGFWCDVGTPKRLAWVNSQPLRWKQ